MYPSYLHDQDRFQVVIRVTGNILKSQTFSYNPHRSQQCLGLLAVSDSDSSNPNSNVSGMVQILLSTAQLYYYQHSTCKL